MITIKITEKEAETISSILMYKRMSYVDSVLYSSGKFVKEFKVIDSVLKKIREGK